MQGFEENERKVASGIAIYLLKIREIWKVSVMGVNRRTSIVRLRDVFILHPAISCFEVREWIVARNFAPFLSRWQGQSRAGRGEILLYILLFDVISEH